MKFGKRVCEVTWWLGLAGEAAKSGCLSVEDIVTGKLSLSYYLSNLFCWP